MDLQLRLFDRAIRSAFGVSNPSIAGRLRVMRGISEHDSRDLYLGLSLLALSYLRRTRYRRELLYRREIAEGAALVIHHKGKGEPRLAIVKPKKRR
jgi:hypothetical protein